MQKYINSVASSTGAPVGGALVQVNVYPGGTPATIYSDNGITQAANPLTTDLANGSFSFYAPDGHYQLVVTGSNIQPITLNDVLLVDAIPSDQAVASSVNSADILSIQQGGTLKQATGSLIASMVLGADSPIPVASGGTGATTAANARTNLGAAASGANGDITSLTGLTTPLALTEGGTGASTATGARAALGLGSMATQNSNSVAITGGSMSGVTLSDLSPTTGATLVGANDGASGSLWTTVAGFIAKIISSAGSAVVGFIQAGIGAVSRSAQDKIREIISVKDFGAIGDGVTLDTAAFAAAVAAYPGRAIFVPDPAVNYVLDATITLPANTIIYGQGKFSTKVFKKGNNDMFKLGDGASIQNMWLDGQGATNTGGRGVVIGAINTTDGHQNLVNVRVVNFPVDCVAFTDINAGSQFIAQNCEFNQYGATTGSNRFAVTVVDASQLSAVPRTFVGCQFNGAPSFNFGGCNDLFISGCFLGDLNFTLNSRSVQISNSRISNQSALSIYGHNHTIVGCDVNPQITLTPGVDNCHIGPNSLNNAPIIDNSGNGRNQIYQWSISYSPTLSTGGTSPTLGNGTLVGRWSRQGSTVHVSIALTIGSTTNLGTGQIQFSLPSAAPNNLDIQQACGSIQMNHSGTNYTGICVVPGASNIVQLLRDTSGAVTFNSPAAWASGDIIVVCFSYDVGV